MWTLIIFVLMAGGPGGGVHTSVTTVQFTDKATCDASAAVTNTSGFLYPSNKVGSYKIIAQCVQN
jgi:hypothetical protein